MRLHAELRCPIEAHAIERNPSDTDIHQYLRISTVGPDPSGINRSHNSTNAIPSKSNDTRVTGKAPFRECSPQTIDLATVEHRSEDSFRFMMKRVWTNFPPLMFQGDTTSLCDEKATGKTRLWDYYLPISGRKDVSSCYGKERHDLLQPLTPSSLCFNSALHMLTVDVYEDMKHLDLHPALLYGTLLGAIRDGLTIPFTEDANIGYNALGDYEGVNSLKKTLATKGYHMFHQKIWRVCIASIGLQSVQPRHGTAAWSLGRAVRGSVRDEAPERHDAQCGCRLAQSDNL